MENRIHNSDLSSDSLSLTELCVSIGDTTRSCVSTSSPKIFAVKLLASKSRSGHSATILLAPFENIRKVNKLIGHKSVIITMVHVVEGL